MNKHMKYVVLTSLMAPMATTIPQLEATESYDIEEEGKWEANNIESIKSSVNKQLNGHDEELKTINTALDNIKAGITDYHNNYIPTTIDKASDEIVKFIRMDSDAISSTYGEDAAQFYTLLNKLTSNTVTDSGVAQLITILSKILSDDSDDDANSALNYFRHILTSGLKTDITGTQTEIQFTPADKMNNELLQTTNTIGKKLDESIEQILKAHYLLSDILKIKDNDVVNKITAAISTFETSELYNEQLKNKLYVEMKPCENDSDKATEIKSDDFKLTYYTSKATADDIKSLDAYNESYIINDELPFTEYTDKIQKKLLTLVDSNLEGLKVTIDSAIQDEETQFKNQMKDASNIKKEDLTNLATSLKCKVNLANIYNQNKLKAVDIQENEQAKQFITRCIQALDSNIQEDQMWGYTINTTQKNYLASKINDLDLPTYKKALTNIVNNYDKLTFNTDITALADEDLLKAVLDEYTQTNKISFYDLTKELTTLTQTTLKPIKEELENIKEENKQIKQQLIAAETKSQQATIILKESLNTIFNTLITDGPIYQTYKSVIEKENDINNLKRLITTNFLSQSSIKASYRIVSLDAPISTKSNVTYDDVEKAIRKGQLDIKSITATKRPNSRDKTTCKNEYAELKEHYASLLKTKPNITIIKDNKQLKEEKKFSDTHGQPGGESGHNTGGKIDNDKGNIITQKLDPDIKDTIVMPTRKDLNIDTQRFENIKHILTKVKKKVSSIEELKKTVNKIKLPHPSKTLSAQEMTAAYKTLSFIGSKGSPSEEEITTKLWHELESAGALTKTEN